MSAEYKIGLVSVSFRNLTPREILEAMRAASISYIEWGSDIHAPCSDRERLFELARLQEEYGIRCCSYGSYFRLGEAPCEEIIPYIEAAKILGTNIIRIWCGRKSGKDMTEEEREELLVAARRVASIAEREGVILCTECHKNTFTECPEDTVWLMRRVNSPAFCTYWQPFQWQSAEDNIKNASLLSEKTVCVHVFNWRGSEKLPLREAICEWREYLSHIPAPRALLLEFMPQGWVEELASEAAALKEITGEMV